MRYSVSGEAHKLLACPGIWRFLLTHSHTLTHTLQGDESLFNQIQSQNSRRTQRVGDGGGV